MMATECFKRLVEGTLVRSGIVRRGLCRRSVIAARGYASLLASSARSAYFFTSDGRRALPHTIRTVKHGIFIQTEVTPNPNSMKFLPGIPILPDEHGTGFHCTRGDKETKRSPFARKIFSEIEDAVGVFIGKNFITITKTNEMSWNIIRTMAMNIIMDSLTENIPFVTDAPVSSDTAINEDDDEVIAMIKELIEEKIRPSVQDDGGDIFFRGFDADLGIVKLQLAGSCKGCPSSSVTLRNGVESMLMHYIPEVQGVEEVADDELETLNQTEVDQLEDRLKKAGIPVD